MRATRVEMDIELLYFDGCPNWEEARGRLAEALAATGNAGTPIRLRRIETPEPPNARPSLDPRRSGSTGSIRSLPLTGSG